MYYKKIKYWIRYFSPILFISLLVFWPSFNLAFDGDSYLTLWRYIDHVKIKNNYTYLSYLLTDYGPQDSIFYLLYSTFGLKPFIFYLISFILRFISSLSFFPVVFLLTKNKKSSYLASLFFSITTTGIESTNWVFNMPSYLSIIFLNFFLYFYLQSALNNKKSLTLSSLFFGLTILSQPIRMVILPMIIIIFEVLMLYINKNLKKQIIPFLKRTTIFITILLLIFLLGKIGGSIGLSHFGSANFTEQSIKRLSSYFSTTIEVISQKNVNALLYPIGQVGAVFFPTDLVSSSRFDNLFSSRFTFNTIILLIIFSYTSRSIGKKVFRNNYFNYLVYLSLWTLIVWLSFKDNILTISSHHYLTMLLGGYLFVVLHSIKNKKINQLGITLAVLLILLGFFIPWLRNPIFIHDTINRYLIVPAVGLSILYGLIHKLTIDQKANKLNIFLIIFLLIHGFATYQYLYTLSKVRNLKITQAIRSSIPYNEKFGKVGKPLVYYFETDNNEQLYHSLLFGFPVIMSFEHNFYYWSNIAYTQSWEEVVKAYQDGSSLKRFAIPPEPVEIDNTYSFLLVNNNLIDTTTETREKLQNIK